jgi:hypothetical protein
MKIHSVVAAGLIACLPAATPWAAVTAEEAKALETTLTGFGAIKAGNADGSIPVYTGGRLAKMPPGYKPGGQVLLADPFKDEKPLYSIDAKNAGQYAALLTEGTKELMKRFPTFRADVYPSHRTMSYPDWVLKNTAKNAVSAKLAGEVIGDAVEGAYGGLPFPIPKNAYEVLWNHTLKYQGARWDLRFTGTLVDSSGKATRISDIAMTQNVYYYDPSKASLPDNWMSKTYINFLGPAANVGTKVLQWGSIEQSKSLSRSWIYTPGQRRTRITPEAAYDTPSATTSGANFFEEQQMYTSRLDRFDFKLVGKKEMLIPYNCYQLAATPSSDFVGSPMVKTDKIRWEKHRVWVIEGTRKPGARHVYAKRTFYVDEDTWAIAASDSWDDSGAMYRVALNFLANPYDQSGFPPTAQLYVDLVKGNYALAGWTGDGGYRRTSEALADDVPLNPDQLAGSGIR